MRFFFEGKKLKETFSTNLFDRVRKSEILQNILMGSGGAHNPKARKDS